MRKPLVSPLMLAAVVSFSAGDRSAGAQASDPLLARANSLLGRVPVIDGHNDFPWQVHELGKGNLDALDIARPQPSVMTDIARLHAGGVGGQFWSVYVPVTLQGAEAVEATLEQIDIVHQMVAKYPSTFALARSAADIARAERAGQIASLIGVEGGHSINNSLGVLRMFYQLGARYMTLTHTTNTPWADSATDTASAHGLTPFGESVVREMNRLGMLVDLSHVAPSTMAAALRVSEAPVIFSHSSARALTDVPRNVPDDILREVARKGGIVMVTFVPGFVSKVVADYTQRETDAQTAAKAASRNDAAAVKTTMDAWHAAHLAPRATVAEVADHIDHVKTVAGIDHIGLGGDFFDGITSVTSGLEDVSTLSASGRRTPAPRLLRPGHHEDHGRQYPARSSARPRAVAARLQKRPAQ